MVGQIKVLKNGFGFITPVEGGKDVFFHASSLQEGLDFNSLRVGDRLSFEIESTPKGLNAVRVSLVDRSEGSSGMNGEISAL